MAWGKGRSPPTDEVEEDPDEDPPEPEDLWDPTYFCNHTNEDRWPIIHAGALVIVCVGCGEYRPAKP